MQYPLRPWWRPYELDERCDKVCVVLSSRLFDRSCKRERLCQILHLFLQVRVKPDSAEVEVDLSIDAESNNFDADSNSKFNMKKQVPSS